MVLQSCGNEVEESVSGMVMDSQCILLHFCCWIAVE
jgi:hypothetical protein